MSWGSQLCNIVIIVYGFTNVLFYYELDIIYYICITTTDIWTHILDLDCVSKIGRDAKSL